MTGFILGVAAALSTLAAGAEPPRPGAEAQVTRCIAARAEKLDFTGVVSIARPGGTTTYLRGALGGPGSVAISAESRFNLASAGKMFTAIAVAQLIDAGKVGLDDPIGRHVDGLTAEAAAVTVRQLLTHSSGLGNFFTLENLAAVQKARTVADLLPLVAAEKPEFPPGTKFQYSNTGFLLLGRLVERVSGQSYEQYLGAHVFGPAGMAATGLNAGPPAAQAIGMTAMPAPQPSAPGAPAREGGHKRMRLGPGGGDHPKGPLRPAAEAALHGNPAGGSYSTAADLQRFFAALLGGNLTSPAMLQQLTSRQIVAAPASEGKPQLDYGLGFGLGAFAGHLWFGHNGGAPGVNAEAAAFPDDRTTVVVLSSRDPPTASALYRELRAAVFDADALQACARSPK